jgi:hypothetical protein
VCFVTISTAQPFLCRHAIFSGGTVFRTLGRLSSFGAPAFQSNASVGAISWPGISTWWVGSGHRSGSFGSMGDPRSLESREPTYSMNDITKTVLINDPSHHHRQEGIEPQGGGDTQSGPSDAALGSERQQPPILSSILTTASAGVEIAWEVLMCIRHPDDCHSFRLKRLCNEFLCTFLFFIYYCYRGLRRALAGGS